MYDIHSHILPEVDDGAKSWDIALEMCRMAQADGIQHMVATPHANERYPYDRPAHETRLAELRTRFGPGMEFSLGCDFHMSFENLQDLQLHPRRYSIGGERYILVELSNYSIPTPVEEAMLKLGDLDLTPVLTHPQRNPILQENHRLRSHRTLGRAPPAGRASPPPPSSRPRHLHRRPRHRAPSPRPLHRARRSRRTL